MFSDVIVFAFLICLFYFAVAALFGAGGLGPHTMSEGEPRCESSSLWQYVLTCALHAFPLLHGSAEDGVGGPPAAGMWQGIKGITCS